MRPLLYILVVLTAILLYLITNTYYEKPPFYSLKKLLYNEKENTSIAISTLGSSSNILTNALF